jgi:LEA14-like dessication related protein
MKKHLNYLFIIFLSISLTSCFSYKELQVKEVESVKILSVNDNTADVEVALRIINPNNSKIIVKSCNLDASINKKEIGKVCFDKKMVIPERSEKTYIVLLKADMNEVKKLMPSMLFASNALLNIKGDMKVRMKFISKNITVDRDEKISRKDLKNIMLVKN